MFDDQPKNGMSNIPPNLPIGEPASPSGGPADMFSDSEEKKQQASKTESALDAGVLRPVVPEEQAPRYVVPPAEVREPYALKEPTTTRALLIIVVAVVIVGVLGAAGWWAYGYFTAGQTPALPTEESAASAETLPQETESPEVTSETSSEPASDIGAEVSDEQILFGEPIDKDSDGLDDNREAELGTNPNNWDSDGDELGDGDEVLIWKTDPLKTDSDGDGYPDGQEVKNGYNPAGPGKIFEPPAS